MARRALWAARRGEAGASADGSVEGDAAGSTARPTAPGGGQVAAERAALHRPRPGDVAREALRRAAARHGGGSAVRVENVPEEPDADGTESVDPVPESVPEPASEPASESWAAVRPDAGAEAPRPGDVAREALRAARAKAERERTSPRTEGVGSRSRPDGAEPTASGRQPSDASRRAAARVRELADQLADAFELPASVEGEPRSARPAEAPDDPPSAPAAPGALAAPSAERRNPARVAPTPPDDSDSAAIRATAAASGGDPRPDTEPVPWTRTTTASHPEDAQRGAAGPVSGIGPTDRPAAPFRRTAAPDRPMASPARDGELRRTFPALPARPQGAEGFAETWWGNAWVAALEEMALDGARLGRGRAYAGQGHVDAITVTPGLVLAYVHGSRPRPYRVQIRMRTLSDSDWERFTEAAAERPGHIAALLDKDLPHSLADTGVDLLPGSGDLEPHCSCPDFGHPCKHAAALCYQTARLLDQDPFVLLLLRGRGERELLDALSRRNAALAARSARDAREPALPGVRARDALAPRTLPPLPAPLPPPPHPEQPPVYPASPGGPDPFALDQLATDAAARAHALLTTGRDPVAELTLWQDAVRLAATRPGSGLTATTRALYASLASAAGRTPAELARAVAAWRQGGLEGLAVLEEPWDPPAGRFDRARPLLLAADFPAFRPWHNQLTHPRGHIQLRLGHDGLWYAYESEPGHDDWWPRGTPDLDPVGALTGLGSPTDL
ncbi:SWIM zinc finger family protein [Streptomyces sp. NPDC050704]|uniref:SWIM zinc finger family protein n=1 Tax=Streptomyces sp. NPDC050704 TaxID=3157219 RepID=UPI00343D0EC4